MVDARCSATARGVLGRGEASTRQGHDWAMRSYAERENVVRRVAEAVEDRQVGELVSDAAARIETLIDSVMGWPCAPENAVWVRARGPRSRRKRV